MMPSRVAVISIAPLLVISLATLSSAFGPITTATTSAIAHSNPHRPTPPASRGNRRDGRRAEALRTRTSATKCSDGSNNDCRSESQLTDWVIENLETPGGESITSSSAIKAGENDTLPISGLCIGSMRVLAADSPFDDDTTTRSSDDSNGNYLQPIRLLMGRNGWGTGVHPTTRLCLEWLCETVQGGEVILDYGTGSGILSIGALHMGASRAVGVDVEAEALVTAERNLELNGYGSERFEGLHTREIEPYGLCRPVGVDICMANILIGQLVRPSMVASILSNLAVGGLLCLSGIRPNEVQALKEAYGDSVEWYDDQYGELTASDCEGSIESYRFDTGRWARLVGKHVGGNDRDADIRQMSELAVS